MEDVCRVPGGTQVCTSQRSDPSELGYYDSDAGDSVGSEATPTAIKIQQPSARGSVCSDTIGQVQYAPAQDAQWDSANDSLEEQLPSSSLDGSEIASLGEGGKLPEDPAAVACLDGAASATATTSTFTQQPTPVKLDEQSVGVLSMSSLELTAEAGNGCGTPMTQDKDCLLSEDNMHTLQRASANSSHSGPDWAYEPCACVAATADAACMHEDISPRSAVGTAAAPAVDHDTTAVQQQEDGSAHVEQHTVMQPCSSSSCNGENLGLDAGFGNPASADISAAAWAESPGLSALPEIQTVKNKADAQYRAAADPAVRISKADSVDSWVTSQAAALLPAPAWNKHQQQQQQDTVPQIDYPRGHSIGVIVAAASNLSVASSASKGRSSLSGWLESDGRGASGVEDCQLSGTGCGRQQQKQQQQRRQRQRESCLKESGPVTAQLGGRRTSSRRDSLEQEHDHDSGHLQQSSEQPLQQQQKGKQRNQQGMQMQQGSGSFGGSDHVSSARQQMTDQQHALLSVLNPLEFVLWQQRQHQRTLLDRALHALTSLQADVDMLVQANQHAAADAAAAEEHRRLVHELQQQQQWLENELQLAQQQQQLDKLLKGDVQALTVAPAVADDNSSGTAWTIKADWQQQSPTRTIMASTDSRNNRSEAGPAAGQAPSSNSNSLQDIAAEAEAATAVLKVPAAAEQDLLDNFEAELLQLEAAAPGRRLSHDPPEYYSEEYGWIQRGEQQQGQQKCEQEEILQNAAADGCSQQQQVGGDIQNEGGAGSLLADEQLQQHQQQDPLDSDVQDYESELLEMEAAAPERRLSADTEAAVAAEAAAAAADSTASPAVGQLACATSCSGVGTSAEPATDAGVEEAQHLQPKATAAKRHIVTFQLPKSDSSAAASLSDGSTSGTTTGETGVAPKQGRKQSSAGLVINTTAVPDAAAAVAAVPVNCQVPLPATAAAVLVEGEEHAEDESAANEKHKTAVALPVADITSHSNAAESDDSDDEGGFEEMLRASEAAARQAAGHAAGEHTAEDRWWEEQQPQQQEDNPAVVPAQRTQPVLPAAAQGKPPAAAAAAMSLAPVAAGYSSTRGKASEDGHHHHGEASVVFDLGRVSSIGGSLAGLSLSPRSAAANGILLFGWKVAKQIAAAAGREPAAGDGGEASVVITEEAEEPQQEQQKHQLAGAVSQQQHNAQPLVAEATVEADQQRLPQQVVGHTQQQQLQTQLSGHVAEDPLQQQQQEKTQAQSADGAFLNSRDGQQTHQLTCGDDVPPCEQQQQGAGASQVTGINCSNSGSSVVSEPSSTATTATPVASGNSSSTSSAAVSSSLLDPQLNPPPEQTCHTTVAPTALMATVQHEAVCHESASTAGSAASASDSGSSVGGVGDDTSQLSSAPSSVHSVVQSVIGTLSEQQQQQHAEAPIMQAGRHPLVALHALNAAAADLNGLDTDNAAKDSPVQGLLAHNTRCWDVQQHREAELLLQQQQQHSCQDSLVCRNASSTHRQLSSLEGRCSSGSNRVLVNSTSSRLRDVVSGPESAAADVADTKSCYSSSRTNSIGSRCSHLSQTAVNSTAGNQTAVSSVAGSSRPSTQAGSNMVAVVPDTAASSGGCLELPADGGSSYLTLSRDSSMRSICAVLPVSTVAAAVAGSGSRSGAMQHNHSNSRGSKCGGYQAMQASATVAAAPGAEELICDAPQAYSSDHVRMPLQTDASHVQQGQQQQQYMQQQEHPRQQRNSTRVPSVAGNQYSVTAPTLADLKPQWGSALQDKSRISSKTVGGSTRPRAADAQTICCSCCRCQQQLGASDSGLCTQQHYCPHDASLTKPRSTRSARSEAAGACPMLEQQHPLQQQQRCKRQGGNTAGYPGLPSQVSCSSSSSSSVISDLDDYTADPHTATAALLKRQLPAYDYYSHPTGTAYHHHHDGVEQHWVAPAESCLVTSYGSSTSLHSPKKQRHRTSSRDKHLTQQMSLIDSKLQELEQAANQDMQQQRQLQSELQHQQRQWQQQQQRAEEEHRQWMQAELGDCGYSSRQLQQQQQQQWDLDRHRAELFGRQQCLTAAAAAAGGGGSSSSRPLTAPAAHGTYYDGFYASAKPLCLGYPSQTSTAAAAACCPRRVHMHDTYSFNTNHNGQPASGDLYRHYAGQTAMQPTHRYQGYYSCTNNASSGHAAAHSPHKAYRTPVGPVSSDTGSLQRDGYVGSHLSSVQHQAGQVQAAASHQQWFHSPQQRRPHTAHHAVSAQWRQSSVAEAGSLMTRPLSSSSSVWGCMRHVCEAEAADQVVLRAEVASVAAEARVIAAALHNSLDLLSYS